MKKNQLNLKDFTFQELQTVSGLRRLDQEFLLELRKQHPVLHENLLAYRQNNAASSQAISQLLIDCGVVLEDFIAQLFAIEAEVDSLQVRTLSHQPIFAFKAYYVLKHARRLSEKQRKRTFFDLNQIIEIEILTNKLNLSDRQLAVAQLGMIYLADPVNCADRIATLIEWCSAALQTPEGQNSVGDWDMFRLPKRLNFDNLMDVQPLPEDPFRRLQGVLLRHRDGFELTDARMSQRQIMREIDYCVYCHENQGDFCSRGFPVKKNKLDQGFKINSLGETLAGCPLEEKISEMHVLKKAGFGVAALAMIMVDNPLCPLTGHRICNDCMKACIYQKQEPVNIPQTETGILTDILHLPWGVEIYDLLSRWNPLRQRQWVPQPYNGLKILVMGMGPAGLSLSHHLLMEGFAVVGMDGLKIEPLPSHYLTQPIYRYDEIVESLAKRPVAGFGGVAEYGITVRWDKNFLKLIYISLLRRQFFQVVGGVRFGGTLKIENAWSLGFDHLALAVGAGLPEALNIPNSLAPGMRQANDFLMALQLTGASRPDGLANLQVRLPVLVIGGGLTAVDTATEVQAYYFVQIEKMAERYRLLAQVLGEDALRSHFLPADLKILDEYLKHADETASERQRALQEKRKPDLIRLFRRWGGVTLLYRKNLRQSPAYRLNHEELAKALEEGVYYAENTEPVEVLLDEDGQARALRCQNSATGESLIFPARCILVATGARLNVAYEFEHRGSFLRQNRFEYRRYERINGYLRQVDTHAHVKSPHFGAFTSYNKGHRTVTFLGDTHPVFHGSVVKAIASGQRVYPEIRRALESHITQGDPHEYQIFRDKINDLFRAVIVEVVRHNHRVIEWIVRAPAAARQGGGGQFYRVQNFGLPQMESLAMIGVPNVSDPDLLSLYVVEKEAGSRMARHLKAGDPVALMGPTGARSTRASNSTTLLLIGDIISPAGLLSMAEKLYTEGHRVWYLGYFEQATDLYHQEKIEAIAEKIVWLTDRDSIPARRPQDQSFANGDVANALRNFPDLAAVGQVWVLGSSCLLRTVQSICDHPPRPFWPEGTPVLGSVYGPMQCMLKGVCAQCLHWQVDPQSGQRTKAVYACSWQHQPLAGVDIHNLEERLSQNRCQETLSDLWLKYQQFAEESVT